MAFGAAPPSPEWLGAKREVAWAAGAALLARVADELLAGLDAAGLDG